MSAEATWTDPTESSESNWSEDVDTTSVAYRDSDITYRDNIINYRGFATSQELLNQVLWSILGGSFTSAWFKNQAFFEGIIEYEDSDIDYDAVLFYEDYDPSTIDEGHDIDRQVEWNDLSDTVESGWSEV